MGKQQSPISMVDGQFNIISTAEVGLEIPDAPEGIEFENLGTTIEGVMEGSGAKINVGGTEFEMKQFHFHQPSEHLDNGTSMPSKLPFPLWPTTSHRILTLAYSGDAHGLPECRQGGLCRWCVH